MADTSRIDEIARRTPTTPGRSLNALGVSDRNVGLRVGRAAAGRAAAAGQREIGKLDKQIGFQKKAIKKTADIARKWAARHKKLAIGTAIAVPVAGALTYGAGLLRGRQGVKTVQAPPKFEDIKIPGRSMLPYQQDENYSDSGGGQRYVTRSEQYAPREQQAPAPQAQYSGGGSYRVSSGERSSLTQTMRNQQKAVRDTKSYLGEAFDATIRKGVTAGRKHLANMLERDGLDQDQGDRIMRKYDSEIGNQTSLKDFKDKGVIDDYESRNPGKGKALLAAYRGRYPAGTTMSEMKAAANASRS